MDDAADFAPAAFAELVRVRSDERFVRQYYDRENPWHGRAMSIMDALYDAAYPAAPAPSSLETPQRERVAAYEPAAAQAVLAPVRS